ncbi:MAG: hypothetical protein U0872_15770 [Planctomycetaceae bacterium]
MQFDDKPIELMGALALWASLLVLFLVMTFIGSLLISTFLYGIKGPGYVFRGIFGGVVELFSLSPRRLWAITMLTFKEAIRRKALLVFVVFAVLFMFAGWFLTGSETLKGAETKVYISFALRTMTWLLMPVMLLLSCWGIPEDIRLRSLHTVVTKPVRRMEVVLGRMFGFSLIGTLILGVMGLVGYVWIVRQVPADYQDQLVCRKPLDGKLEFLDRLGMSGTTGINVGDMSTFRSYIEGATKSRAIWTFEQVTPAILHSNKCFRLESRFQAFRTLKGDMNRSVYFQYTFKNPDDPSIAVPLSLIQVNENRVNDNYVSINPIQLVGEDGKPLSSATGQSAASQRNFFKDVVSKDGKVLVEVACVDPGMYLGVARVDLFFRRPDGAFWIGYVKSLLGVESMLLLIVILGVTASTFVKGPVATFFTFCVILVGMFGQQFMDEIIKAPEAGGFAGGGVFESIYRMIMHLNPSTELPAGPAFYLMQLVDWLLKLMLWSVRYYIPNGEYFNRMPEYLANGFDVDWMRSLLPCLLVTVGFFIPCLFIGYYSLRLRELESK